MTNSANIEITTFRQAYYLPLIWRDRSFLLSDVAGPFAKFSGHDRNEDTRPAAAKFAEWTYFHDFIRDTIFDSPAKNKEYYRKIPLRHPKALQFDFGEGKRFTACVSGIDLNLFGNGVATLRVDLLWPDVRTLADMLLITNRVRRMWPPFWDQDKADSPGYVPQRSGYVGELVPATAYTPQAYWGAANEGSGLKMLKHWEILLQDIDQKQWRMPSDERLPVQSFVALKQQFGSNSMTLSQVNDADWWRMAECDGPGEAYGYNPDFLTSTVSNPFYDRFFPHDGIPDYIATRQVIAASHHALVTVDDGDFMPGMLETHLTNHYAKMAVLIRHEHASLLKYSRDMSDLIRNADRGVKNNRRLSDRIIALHREFLNFVHLHRFTGVSDQIQPTEMYNQWRRVSHLDTLFEDVRTELSTAAEFANADAAQRYAGEANRLSTLAGVVAVIVTPFAIMSTPWIATLPERLNVSEKCATWIQAGATVSLLALFAFLYKYWRKKHDFSSENKEKH